MNSILKKYTASLDDYANHPAMISAATPLELSKRDGIYEMVYAMKLGSSSADGYYEDNRVEREVFTMDVTSFVETKDTHTDRDNKYKLMLDMTDKVRGWVKQLDNSTIDSDILYTKYIGVINVVDDQPGFYAMVQRLEFNVNQQTQ